MTKFVNVQQEFFGGTETITIGNREVEAEVADAWIAAGRATEVPCLEWTAGIHAAGNVPDWVKKGESSPSVAPKPYVPSSFVSNASDAKEAK